MSLAFRLALSAVLLAPATLRPPAPLASQGLPPGADPSFLDPMAESLYRSAQGNWASVNESVLRYTARIQQRLAAGVRAPSRDRVLFRQETAVRAFWDREEDAWIQVLAARRESLDGVDPWRDGEDWLNALTFEYPFQPGGERLFFGMEEQLQGQFFPGEETFWLMHPLAPGADSLFRYRSGDTLTLSLPDGRRFRAVQLHVLPREPDPRRIAGTLWIDPESGGLVRAAYRLSRPLNATTDLPELRDGFRDTRFDLLPGFARPWTVDLTLVVMDYSLWDHRVWLPRTMRVEAEARAGQVTFPFALDVNYDLEAVVLEGGEDQVGELEMPSGPFQDRDGVSYELIPQLRRSETRRSRVLVPTDRELLAAGPYLPPPIWEERPQFASREELLAMGDLLHGIRSAVQEGVPGALSWGWSGHDLLRYNRVEGLAVGGRVVSGVSSPVGPLTFHASAFFGLADRGLKVRVGLEHPSPRRRIALGAYRELRPMQFRGSGLAFGNSLNAFFFGRDYGEYLLATGMDLLWRTPESARQSLEIRLYGERQSGRNNETSFSLVHAFDGDWAFRPNAPADEVEELGGELFLSPAWGSDPDGAHLGLVLYGQGAVWEGRDSVATGSFLRGSALARLTLPLDGKRWQVGLEVAGGGTLGEATRQRRWLLGGPETLRGYDAGFLAGRSFGRARLEVQRSFGLWGAGVFGDVAEVGERGGAPGGGAFFGVGFGISALDGLVRADLCWGLTGPTADSRVEIYLDGIF